MTSELSQQDTKGNKCFKYYGYGHLKHKDFIYYKVHEDDLDELGIDEEVYECREISVTSRKI